MIMPKFEPVAFVQSDPDGHLHLAEITKTEACQNLDQWDRQVGWKAVPLHTADQLTEAYEAGKREASEDIEQAAFEKWLYDKCPSGDVESVQRQWLESYEYAELAGKMEQAAQINHLQMALADTEALEIGTGERLAKVTQHLVEAQATLVLKDDALTRVCGHIGLYNLFSCVGGDSFDPECAELNAQKCREIAKEALTIRPGNEALEKWIGEQSGWTHSCPVLCLDGVELWIDRCPHCGRPAPKGLK